MFLGHKLWMPTTRGVFDFLEFQWPGIIGRPIESMLYVGHRHDTHPWWCTSFARAIGSPHLAVLDLQHDNLQTAAGITSDLILGDIRDTDNLKNHNFDLIFWDEGPEHCARQVALDTLVNLRKHCKIVLISCPWGHQPQGSGPDDPEFHHWGPQTADFESIGMSAQTHGFEFDGKGHGHGSVVAWF